MQTFDPKSIEKRLSAFWVEKKIGKPSQSGKPYCIMVPPPNVTGRLHLGHALQQAIMDTLTRQMRSCGYNTLLQVGTDHAGIATQMVVERQLEEQGIYRKDLSREAFVEKVWEWKEQSGGTITDQMKRMGMSVDWDSECFTLDAHFSHAVNETFIKLYNEGYIYRGKRLINWDTQLQTAVSDLEVVNETRQGQIWYIHYPLENGENLTVATTRPETMFGDMAVCVHPEDPRYQHLIGQQIKLPLTDRLIPVIADDAVDPEFGTGCVKVTPAHDFTDNEIGKRHQLQELNILTPDGHLNTDCPEPYQGMDRFVARKAAIKALKELNLLEKVEPHTAALPIGDRSGSVLEPYLTDQWFMKMDDMASEALNALTDGSLTFVPDNWRKTYQQWLDNIQDWCISRQLWWGHRIPAYYDDQGNVYVGESEDSVRTKHKITGDLKQDNDTLDTWFSSALWPFATLGWPKDNSRLEQFYPNQVLVTGFDIIFFWVARMVMLGQHLTDKTPFKQVYITGLIRDEKGQKMSKSKGNVLDPIDLIEGATLDELIAKRTKGMMQPAMKEAATKATKKAFPEGLEAYGTDALRFTLLWLSTNGRDIRFDLNKLKACRFFCNKIWNGARFVLSHSVKEATASTVIEKALCDQIHQLLTQTQKHLDEYRFDRYAKTIHDFFWHDFCDWHIELAKVNLGSDTQINRMSYLHQVLDALLIIMHPALPFITEEFWQIKHGNTEDSITSQPMPLLSQWNADTQSCEQFERLKTLITGIRTIRSELNIPPKSQLILYCMKDQYQLFNEFNPEITALAGISTINHIDTAPKACCGFVADGIDIALELTGQVDAQAEIDRLNKRIAKIDKDISKLHQKTNNPKYMEKAPAELQKQDSISLSDLHSQQQQLEVYLKTLSQLS